MESKAVLTRIRIFPIKSLDGLDLVQAEISPGGGLVHDREFAIFDGEGNPLIGKTTALVHGLQGRVDFENQKIAFCRRGESIRASFDFLAEIKQVDAYLSDYFGFPAYLKRNRLGRFIDKPDWSGVTLVSTASLQAISNWYQGIDLDETRNRFRATLEIDGVPAFWEDRLFGPEGSVLEYHIGDVRVFGISPRSRCIVPTRNPETGIGYGGFARTFSKQRLAHLPEYSGLKEYDNQYYLTVDSYLPDSEIGKVIRVGDPVTRVGITSVQPLQRAF